MNVAPRVSIVIPVFNDESTVAATLDSCLAQTLADVEIICVDDASTDTTVEVIRQYEALDSRVRLIRQPLNLSAFQARRAAVSAAVGEYVLFADGDDELKPEAAATSLAAAQRHHADLVGFAIEVINPQGQTVGGYQSRLSPQHEMLSGRDVLSGLFPVDQPAQGQLWRYLFRTELLREAYGLLPEDVVLPRVNDLPLVYLVAALASRYVSIGDVLYRYYYGRGGSGRTVATLERAQFYAEAIRSIDTIAPAVRSIARATSEPAALLDNYESVRLSVIGYVCAYLLKHTPGDLAPQVLDHLHTRASATDIVVAAVRFYPDSLDALKRHSRPTRLAQKPVRSVMLTTRTLTTGGVSGVLLAQASFLLRAGYRVVIVARRYGSDTSVVPPGAHFIEMVSRGLPDRLVEWAEICRAHSIDVVIDHQVLYSRDWPEYALMARALGVPTIGWLHSFAGRPLYDLNGLHAVIQSNASLLEALVTLSPLDVAFWKLRGIAHAAYVPNPPSPMLLEHAGESAPRALTDKRRELIWWGRLDERTKKVSELIEVADHLRRLAVDFRITVIGPDSSEWTAHAFNSAVRKRRLEAYVEAVGEKHGPRLIEAIDSADAFVTTSIIEGYQLTIAEAQSRGLPVFMYELPWLTLVHENGGVVAVPQGDAAALALQIAAAFESPELYSELSRASLAAADRALSHDFGRLYEDVITGRLPSEYSPEPTLDDARQLLDLMIFFAEQNAGARSDATSARKPANLSSGGGKPSLAHRAWLVAKPLGSTVLQVLPGLRPLAHRVKQAIHVRGG